MFISLFTWLHQVLLQHKGSFSAARNSLVAEAQSGGMQALLLHGTWDHGSLTRDRT